MDPAHVVDAEFHDMREVARGEPAVAVAQADHVAATVDRFDRGRRDNSIDPGCRAATYQYRQSLLRTILRHRIMNLAANFRSYTLSAVSSQESTVTEIGCASLAVLPGQR